MNIGFKQAMKDAGFEPPNAILADGVLHRFYIAGDRPGTKNGWYILHDGAFPHGSFGSWKLDIEGHWTAKDENIMTLKERSIYFAQVAEQRKQAEEEKKLRHAEARKMAVEIWEQAKPANPEHPYLVKKKIKPYGIKQAGENLVVPVRGNDDVLRGLQFIGPDGIKKFLTGTEVKGSYLNIGNPTGKVLICEGYATAATLHEACDQAVVIAFNAGNLLSVANTIREQYPNATLILCADDDWQTSGNPGLTKATEAALTVNGLLAVPTFPGIRDERDSDFNDLARLSGLESVKICVLAAKEVIAPRPASEGANAFDEDVARLAALPLKDYEKIRKDKAKELNVRTGILDKLVETARKGQESSSKAIVEEIEPWDQPIKGNVLLNTLHDILKKYVILEPAAATAIALWIILTYCYDLFRILPLLGITSPEKRCGKTSLLEVLTALSNKALLASSISASAIFRTVEKYRPTLLVDEADTFLKDNNELKGILNSGHTVGAAFVVRVNPETLEPERFSTWGPKGIAMIGELPGTIADRAIRIRLERKTANEKTNRLGIEFVPENRDLRRAILRWVVDNAEMLRAATPDIPRIGNDRAEDNWMPLLAIAEVVGDGWPERAREAMMVLEGIADSESIKQILLQDIRDVFDEKDRLSSKELVDALVAIEDHPWCEWRGRGLTQNILARLLKPFQIKSRTIRIENAVSKGYQKEQFDDVFARYLPPTPFQTVTTLQPAPVKDLRDFQTVTNENDVTLSKHGKPAPVLSCNVVTDKNPLLPGGKENKHPKPLEIKI